MKISIIGAGKVGVAVAVQLLARGVARELVLMSRDERRAQGEAMDLAHAQALHPSPARIRAGGVEATAGSGILVVCASAELEPGKVSRLSLGPANTRMLEKLLPDLLERSPEAMVLMVSNPVDVLTWQALRISGLPASRVFGTGTLLDSARFRRVLSDELAIHPDDLRAYILGEHGESQFPAMSMAMAGAERIDDTPQRREWFRETVDVGLEIFRRKGHTSHGIAAATAAVVQSIVQDEKRTMPLSVRVDGFCGVEGVCLSLPVVVGAGGIERVLCPALNEEECAAFRHSAAVVRGAIDGCGAE
jgi:L-lactate dehydrogenase